MLIYDRFHRTSQARSAARRLCGADRESVFALLLSRLHLHYTSLPGVRLLASFVFLSLLSLLP